MMVNITRTNARPEDWVPLMTGRAEAIPAQQPLPPIPQPAYSQELPYTPQPMPPTVQPVQNPYEGSPWTFSNMNPRDEALMRFGLGMMQPTQAGQIPFAQAMGNTLNFMQAKEAERKRQEERNQDRNLRQAQVGLQLRQGERTLASADLRDDYMRAQIEAAKRARTADPKDNRSTYEKEIDYVTENLWKIDQAGDKKFDNIEQVRRAVIREREAPETLGGRVQIAQAGTQQIIPEMAEQQRQQLREAEQAGSFFDQGSPRYQQGLQQMRSNLAQGRAKYAGQPVQVVAKQALVDPQAFMVYAVEQRGMSEEQAAVAADRYFRVKYGDRGANIEGAQFDESLLPAGKLNP